MLRLAFFSIITSCLLPTYTSFLNSRIASLGRIEKNVYPETRSHRLDVATSRVDHDNCYTPPPTYLSLPALTRREKLALAEGERIQKQDRMMNAGRGIVVMDVQASKEEIFKLLQSFHLYDRFIPTVRGVNVYHSSASKTAAEFKISKFCLMVNVVHTVSPETDTISFSLDRSRPNLVLREASGFWHLQTPADRPEGFTRVWFSASVVATRLLPTFIVDYAASKALPRATNWMQPYFQSSSLKSVP